MDTFHQGIGLLVFAICIAVAIRDILAPPHTGRYLPSVSWAIISGYAGFTVMIIAARYGSLAFGISIPIAIAITIIGYRQALRRLNAR